MMGSGSMELGVVREALKPNPIGVTMHPASLRPPPLAGGDDDGQSSSWVMLDVKAYIADRSNATTAKDFTRDGHEIRVTLCVTRPPRVSYFCVHCPALQATDFDTEPLILATDDNLILLRAAVGAQTRCYEHDMLDFFIYQAAPLKEDGGKGPSLTRLPHPGPSRRFLPCEAGLLCYSSGGGDGYFLRSHGITDQQQHYIVAAFTRCTIYTPRPEDHLRYYLHRFHSKDGKWTTKVLKLGPMEPSRGLSFFKHSTDKVITLGGGFMGWVDLCQGILLCNVLLDQPELHYIPLPQLLEPNIRLTCANAENTRDVAIINGYIKYVEHNTHFNLLPNSKDVYIHHNWSAATASWKINLDCWEGQWLRGCEYDASRISGSLSKMLPGYNEDPTAPLPQLQGLQTGLPTLSLDEDEIIYFLAKVGYSDDTAFVFAVDMRNGSLQGADYFGAERIAGISSTYTQSRISNYLKIAPGAGKREKQNKRPGLFLGSCSNKRPGVNMTT